MLKGHGGNPRAAAELLGLDPAGITDFSASVNPFVDEAVLREILEESLAAVTRYPDPEYAALKQTIARRYGIERKNILAGNGSTELLYLVPRALAPKSALIVSPSYADYADALRLAGAEVERLFLNAEYGFAPDMDGIAMAVQGRGMAVIGNPNNPTGTAFDKDALLNVIRDQRQTLFMVDESFADFAPENSLLSAREPNLIVIRSLTKFYGIPGLRLGFACGPVEILERLNDFKEPWTVNCVAEAAATVLLEHPVFAETASVTAFLRQRFFERLSTVPSLRVFPSAANFQLGRLEGGGMTAEKLQSVLLKKGFLIRDCANFAGLDARYFRVAVRSAEENARLAEAIRAVLG